MQTVRPAGPPKNDSPIEDKLLTRPLPAWVNATTFLWLLAAIAAVVAGLYLLLARPITGRTWQADNLTAMVPEKNDYRLYRPETDDRGNRFAWTHPTALVIIPASNHTGRAVTVTIRARGASAAGGPASVTRLSANGVALGEIQPIPGSGDFQDFTFRFAPAYNDNLRINLNFDTPGWKPQGDPRELGIMLQAVSVDLQETWSPLFKPERSWLTWLLPLLALLSGLAWIGGRTGPPVLKAAGIVLALAAAGLALGWFWLTWQVGYNGELNRELYWLYAAGSLYLAGFFAGVAVCGWKVVPAAGGQGIRLSLWEWGKARIAAWNTRHPALVAFGVIFLFNLALSLVFVGKLVLQSGSIAPVFRYWDGPEYVVIANNFYDPKEPLLAVPDFGMHSPYYWAAHFPGFSVALMLLKPLVGWLWAPLVANFLASTAFAWVFYRLVRDFGYARQPLWLSLVALVLPVRWLIYHNVGGSEPLFMFFEVLSIYCYKKERYWLAGLAGFGAIFTRPPGIFLWAGFMLLLVFEAAVKTWNNNGFSPARFFSYVNWKAFVALLLIPLGLLAVFGIYGWRYGDFLAYFKIEENVTHVGLLPFPTLLTGLFESPALIYTYILSAVGLVVLWRQRRYDIFWIALASFFYTLFLIHSDVLRYSLPFFALIVLIPLANYASGRTARWLALPVLVMLFFYSWGAFDRNLAWLETFDQIKKILSI